jgi:hypothetical protein
MAAYRSSIARTSRRPRAEGPIVCIIRGATACDFAIQVGTAERKVIIETSAHLQEPAKLKLDRHFQPCPAEPGDELYPNGIFEFNITQLLDFIRTQAEPFPIESVALADIPDYGGSARLDAAAIEAADLSRPVLLAEIAPGRYNLIDGHHRVAKARREGVHSIPAHRVRCPEHVAFLTSARAYEAYVNYWNDKVDAASSVPPARRRRRSARC